jgi:hypothetical protein
MAYPCVFYLFKFLYMAYPYKGNWGSKWYSTKTTTAYAVGEICMDDATDIIPGTSAATNIVGICDQVKTVADTGTQRIKFRVPKDRFATFVAAATGTLTAAMEGRRFDLSNSTTVNCGATTYKVAKVEKFISATLGEFSISTPLT